MSQPDFYIMCATVFAPDDRFDESAMRLYLEELFARWRTNSAK